MYLRPISPKTWKNTDSIFVRMTWLQGFNSQDEEERYHHSLDQDHVKFKLNSFPSCSETWISSPEHHLWLMLQSWTLESIQNNNFRIKRFSGRTNISMYQVNFLTRVFIFWNSIQNEYEFPIKGRLDDIIFRAYFRSHSCHSNSAITFIGDRVHKRFSIPYSSTQELSVRRSEWPMT